MTTGYSETPLTKKLGIKENTKLYLFNAPDNYYSLLGPLPENIVETNDIAAAGLFHIFSNRRGELEIILGKLFPAIRRDSAVWVSWYKKAAKLPTEITEDIVREICLPMGFVDIKVCAVDDLWSGLKLVIRKELR